MERSIPSPSIYAALPNSLDNADPRREITTDLLESVESSVLPTQARRSTKRDWWAYFSDTWVAEITATALSIACSIAIAILLAIWSGKQVPHLVKGITVNAVVSILATTSKSAMLFVVAACIAQLKWLWYGRVRPLADIQTFDDATRGPLGAIFLLADHTILSLGALGASITILALAFDPFVQQTLAFPLQPVNTSSSGNIAKQALAVFGASDDSIPWAHSTQALSNAYWGTNFDPQLQCTASNCTWPTFKTLSFCQKCQPLSPIVIKPVNWTDVLRQLDLDLNTTVPVTQEVTVNDISPVVLNMGTAHAYHHNNTDDYPGNRSYSLMTNLVQDTVWEVANIYDLLGPIYQSLPSDKPLPSTEFLGFKNPLQVYGFTSVAWSENGANMDNTTICALDFCLQELKVSVIENQPIVEVVNTTYGAKSYAAGRADPIPEMVRKKVEGSDGTWSSVCWTPDDTTPTSVHYQYSNSLADFCPYDPDTHAFCSCQSEWYFGLRNVPVLFDRIGGNFTTDAASLDLISTPEGLAFNTSQYADDWQDAIWYNADYADIRYGELTSSNYPRLYSMGIETFTSNLAQALSNQLRDYGWSNITGSTISMLPQVEVRWYWLTLPALLNLASAIFLGLTIYTTHKHKTPLWKTSLVASLFHGLEPDLQDGPTDTRVSQMDLASKELKVRLKRSMVVGKMVFEKGG